MRAFTENLWSIIERANRAPKDRICDLFLRGLGLIYFSAFVSLWVQVRALAGPNGILPAGEFLQGIQEQAGARLIWQFPTLCWWSAGDASLLLQCAIGTAASILLVVGFAPRISCALLWVLWLSLTVACQDFLGFQWENLLLESGLLAIFLAPGTLWLHQAPPVQSTRSPRGLVIWLYQWLLFRLMFFSGVVKLASGDPTWRNFTALFYHYETQPLPTVFGWYAYQLPSKVLVLQTGMMFLIELVIPFLIFCGRKAGIVACAAFVLLQGCIAVTGNYAYFNLLTILLCLFLLDDEVLSRFLPKKWRDRRGSSPPEKPAATPAGKAWLGANLALCALVLVISLIQIVSTAGLVREWPGPLIALYRFVQPIRSINTYGLFAVMTQTRDEIIVEGSADGLSWSAYEFKYKPGEVTRRPRFAAPHQPRLDWQMWFAALGTARENPWFIRFCIRLLEGEPEVLALLEKNPFPARPPKYIRAVLYRYEFTNRETLRKTGAWWKRTERGLYLPPISLREKESP